MKKTAIFFAIFFWSLVACAQISFFSAATYTTGAGTSPFAVTAGDFDGDGDNDLATANNANSTVVIFINRCGILTYGSSIALPVGGTAPIDIACGDLDGDGDLDLVTANNTSSNISVFTGNGNCTFTAAANYTAGTNPRNLILAYLDAGTDLDAAVTNNGSGNVSVLMGAAGATFAAAANTAVASVRGIVAGDFDADGDNDLAVGASAGTTISILDNNPIGTFTVSSSPSIAANSVPLFLVAGNFDSGTDLDLSIAQIGTDGVVSVLGAAGTSFGSLSANHLTGGADDPAGIAKADFDNDGKLDVVTANLNGAAARQISFFSGNGNGTFGSALNYAMGVTNPRYVIVVDMNNDGQTDIVTANSGSNNISIMLNAARYTGTIDDKMNMIYSSASNHPHYGYSLVGMQDGGYLIAGKSQGWGNAGVGISAGYNGYCNSLMKVDKNGALQWIRGYFMASDGNSNGETRHIIQSNDGHYIFCGKRNIWGSNATYISVMKVTACGDTIWTKVFDQATGSASESAMHIERAYTTAGADDGYIVVGNNSVNEILLLKISESGTLQWSKKYAPWSVSEAKTVIPVDDNDADLYKDDGYLIAGYANNASGSGSGKDALVMRTDASGNVSWAKAYGSNSNSNDDELYAAQQMYGDGQDFIVAGYTKSITGGGQQAALTLKIQTDGTQTTPGGWNNFMYTTNTIAYDVKIVDDTDGDSNPDDGFIIVGSMDNAAAAVQNTFVYNTAASGARLWVDSISVKKTTPTSQDEVFAVIQTKDYGYAAAGRTSYYGTDNTYLIKTTSAGILAGDLNICSSPNLSGVTVGTTNPTTWSGSTADTPSPLTYTVTAPMPSTLTTSTRIPSETEICVSNPLPIQLISFSANCLSEKQETRLSWSTTSETNNNFFTVERSQYGQSFDAIGYVNGAGNSNTVLNYEFTDDIEYVSNLSAQIYYRLKQTDFNGQYDYFGPLASSCSRDGFTVLPSINSGTFFIQNTSSAAYSLRIFNLLGEVIYEKPLSEDVNSQVVLTEPNGPYFAEIITAAKIISKKIIINK